MLIAACSVIFAACGSTEELQMDEIKKSLSEANTKVAQLEQKLNEKQKEIDALKVQNSLIEVKTNDAQVDDVRLCDIDINSYEKLLTEDIIAIDKGKTVQENVKKVAEKAMSIFYKDNKYEISFREEKGKNIIVLNLIDEKGSNAWYQTFQGSTGGLVNSKRIIENILQRDYKGKWIDGLNVLYNGKKAEFQHAPDLENIIYK